MRILTISNCPCFEYLGSGYVIANFVRGMRALGHELDLLQPDNYEVCQGVRPRANSYRQALGMLLAVKRSLRAKSYDLIEFWGGEAWLATRWLVRHKKSRPMIVQHTNGPEPRYASVIHNGDTGKWKRKVQASLMLKAFTRADALVTVCSYDEEWLKERPELKCKPIMAIEPALNPVMLGLPFEPRSALRIGFSGSWIPRKGIHLLVEAMSKLLREIPELTLSLAGVGEGFDSGRYFPTDIASRVEVHPMIRDKSRLREYYQSMSILIFPSLGESFGMVLPEAMACGCAVISTRTGFASTLANEKEALLLNEATSENIYYAAKRLLHNTEERNQIAEGGWRRAQDMRWDDACLRLEKFYSEQLATFRERV